MPTPHHNLYLLTTPHFMEHRQIYEKTILYEILYTFSDYNQSGQRLYLFSEIKYNTSKSPLIKREETINLKNIAFSSPLERWVAAYADWWWG